MTPSVQPERDSLPGIRDCAVTPTCRMSVSGAGGRCAKKSEIAVIGKLGRKKRREFSLGFIWSGMNT